MARNNSRRNGALNATGCSCTMTPRPVHGYDNIQQTSAKHQPVWQRRTGGEQPPPASTRQLPSPAAVVK
jgi:hypothetical protein